MEQREDTIPEWSLVGSQERLICVKRHCGFHGHWLRLAVSHEDSASLEAPQFARSLSLPCCCWHSRRGCWPRTREGGDVSWHSSRMPVLQVPVSLAFVCMCVFVCHRSSHFDLRWPSWCQIHTHTYTRHPRSCFCYSVYKPFQLSSVVVLISLCNPLCPNT